MEKGYLPSFLLLLIAFILRGGVLGNPFVEFDEQFYLFVGGQILRGYWPYVDIWDRKPIGLFLLYAFFHLFGAWRVWAYQIGALLSVWATSLLVLRMTRLIAPFWGSFLAAILYMAWINLGRGEGGQSPVFYNLFVTLAMALIVFRLPRLWVTGAHGTCIGRRTGIDVMLLFGLAMQIKYTAVFEGIFAGCFLLYTAIKAGCSWRNIVIDALLWISVAILPTFLAFGAYVFYGHGHDWFFANVISIFHRKQEVDASHNAIWMLENTIPLFVIFPLTKFLGCSVPDTKRTQYFFLQLWAVVALLAVAVFGTWFRHYILPVLAPCLILAAPLTTSRSGRVWLLVLFVIPVFVSFKVIHKMRYRAEGDLLPHIVAIVESAPGCFFDYDSPLIAVLDHVPYCSLTRYPFPWHLAAGSERNALGVDVVAEMKHILSLKPRYVLVAASKKARHYNDYNKEVTAILFDALQHYEKIYQDPNGDGVIYRLIE